MGIQVTIIIAGQIDSKALWKLIEPYKINVTDFGYDKINVTDFGYETWVYGKVNQDDVRNIISLCCRFGKVKVYF